ncbi:tumor necrosis factor ligand superfamily member 6 [Sphaeramia orbicularis]|uniref:Tumor necrosis factor ligand superfamily member 6 n=1 Tax=Sphaeramia orbicularis TaxID=375764 RepID=A0A672ZYT3_9TELE|nr:tumor necrosis factor ligand superfamily member 6-like [Sphaeramia orbicularis]
MSCDQSYPFPQVFLVNGSGGPQQSGPLPNLIPCWSFPPAQEMARRHGKSRGCMGVSYGLVFVVLMLFLLVFAALGIGAWKIINIQRELQEIRNNSNMVAKPEKKVGGAEFNTPQKQTGLPWWNRGAKEDRPAAHVIGKFDSHVLPHTLRWESKAGRAFTSGGVSYRREDGGLQVNETGLYHVYSRVEMSFTHCPKPSFNHTVFVRRAGHPIPLRLMVANKKGVCSQHQGPAWNTDSYLAAAMQLEKYDRVYVNVSHIANLHHEHYVNFFGLYKI